MEASSLLSPSKLQILNQLDEQNRTFFKWFLAVSEIPHGSYHSEALSQKVQEWATHFGFKPETDSSHNVIIRIPSNIDKPDLPTVALQSHLDMVLNGDIKPDQPVPVELQELEGQRVLISPNSTLGADDGFGMATMLEILENSNMIKHGPLELIFTTDEEPCLIGIRSLQPPPFLKFNYLLNLDSLNGEKVYVGCCGGVGLELKYNLAFEPISPEDYSFLRINLQGLHGGHSGMNIGKGYANSIKWCSRILSYLIEKEVPFRFVNLEGGSETKNAIPTAFNAIIAIPKSMKDAALDYVHEIHTKIMFEYFRIECTDFFTEYIEVTNPTGATVSDSKRYTDLLLLLPNGVHRMSPQFPDTVQTSDSISLLRIKNGQFEVHFYMRSSSQSQLELLMSSFYALLRVFGEKYDIKELHPYPAWEPRTKSKLAKLVQQVYKEKTNENIEFGLLSVSVEPSMFVKLGYTDAEIVSVCPSIPLAHAPGEWVSIDESVKWRNVIHASIEKLASND